MALKPCKHEIDTTAKTRPSYCVECDYDRISEQLLDVRARPGQIN